MNCKDLYISFNEVDDDILERSEITAHNRKKPAWLKWGALAACCCLVVGAVLLLPRNDVIVPPVDSFPDDSNSSIIGSEAPVENSNNSERPDIYDDLPSEGIVTFLELDSVPEITLPSLSADDYTPMSSSEMFDYYGINLQAAIPDGFEETPGTIAHGFYGSFDLNQFVFSYDIAEIMVYISKESEIGQYAADFYSESLVCSTIHETEVMLSRYEYDTGETNLYAAFEYNGCDLIVIADNVEPDIFVTILENLLSDE